MHNYGISCSSHSQFSILNFPFFLLLALVASLQSLEAPPVAAATRHFAVAGTNTNPCTEAAPCLTAAPFEAELEPGDRLLFRRGETFRGKQFKLTPVRSGVADNPIYYGAYGTGERPLFDSGDPTFAGDGGADGLHAQDVAWLVIEDLAFSGWGSALEFTGARDIAVRRVASTGGSSGACVVIRGHSGRPSERLVVDDVELARCGINANGEGVYIGTNPGKDGAPDATGDIVLRRLYIHDRTHDEAIELKNCVRRITIEDSRLLGSGTSAHGHGIAAAPSSADCPGSNGDHVIRRNVIEQIAARAIHLGTGGTITQNLLRRNGGTSAQPGMWVEDLPGDGHPVVIEHNAIVWGTGAAIHVESSAQAQTLLQGNLAWGNDSGNTPRPPRPPCLPPRRRHAANNGELIMENGE